MYAPTEEELAATKAAILLEGRGFRILFEGVIFQFKLSDTLVRDSLDGPLERRLSFIPLTGSERAIRVAASLQRAAGIEGNVWISPKGCNLAQAARFYLYASRNCIVQAIP